MIKNIMKFNVFYDLKIFILVKNIFYYKNDYSFIFNIKPITHYIRIFIYDFFYYLYKYGATLIYPKIKYLNVYGFYYLPQLFYFCMCC